MAGQISSKRYPPPPTTESLALTRDWQRGAAAGAVQRGHQIQVTYEAQVADFGEAAGQQGRGQAAGPRWLVGWLPEPRALPTPPSPRRPSPVQQPPVLTAAAPQQPQRSAPEAQALRAHAVGPVVPLKLWDGRRLIHHVCSKGAILLLAPHAALRAQVCRRMGRQGSAAQGRGVGRQGSAGPSGAQAAALAPQPAAANTQQENGGGAAAARALEWEQSGTVAASSARCRSALSHHLAMPGRQACGDVETEGRVGDRRSGRPEQQRGRFRQR